MQHANHSEKASPSHGKMKTGHYWRFGVMSALSFLAMYVLMYAMVDRLSNVYVNFNQAYMAGLMAAPMVLIEVTLMGAMYANRKLNAAIAGAAVGAGILFFVLIRTQGGIGDREFLRSMIPHHASALLMCEQANIESAEIKALCTRPQGIVESQKAEIDLMKTMLKEGRN